MNDSVFWSIIDFARKNCDNDDDLFVSIGIDELSKYPVEDIFVFNHILNYYLRKSYTRELWAAANIINGGASDDGFDYFRPYLLSFGRKFFLDAVNDPDSLADTDFDEGENECILYIASYAFRKKMEGKNLDFYDELDKHEMSEKDLFSLGVENLDYLDNTIGIIDDSEDQIICPNLYFKFYHDSN
ncbi:hypothetical protein TRFO_18516 [Tritrichomonas foetus]|uniref:DUF4240 domain-containing protein n=1 Tax=Tritrichomonas foetus TaxID=1144522 RepID=A0A1J4KLM4_9EUKA|nr:hypothetical protein TRFO_18516 [Tritrichomonas foetus]|eukprot:OHT11840.1 hypothetical protein TRFO_18516 [Tritrichomonas foetus]